MKTLVFKYGTSRGRDTYGYNLVTLTVDGVKVATECGGGYDMQGAALGAYLTKAFQTHLQAADLSDLYGVRNSGGRVVVDGACGMRSVEIILHRIGLTLQRLNWASNSGTDVYILQ